MMPSALMPSLGSVLLTVGLLWAVVLPAAVVVAILIEPLLFHPEPLYLRRCRSTDPTDPTAPRCWVPVGECCPKHDRAPQPDGLTPRQPLIA